MWIRDQKGGIWDQKDGIRDDCRPRIRITSHGIGIRDPESCTIFEGLKFATLLELHVRFRSLGTKMESAMKKRTLLRP